MDGFDKVTLLNKECFFTVLRIKKNEVPQGMYKYDLRHADDNAFDPVTIEKNVWVNHYGTILCKEPFELIDGLLEIEEGGFMFNDEVRMVMK